LASLALKNRRKNVSAYFIFPSKIRHPNPWILHKKGPNIIHQGAAGSAASVTSSDADGKQKAKGDSGSWSVSHHAQTDAGLWAAIVIALVAYAQRIAARA